jgi:peptidyl-prolyl cis-trans isomerase A (cyclophilin A)
LANGGKVAVDLGSVGYLNAIMLYDKIIFQFLGFRATYQEGLMSNNFKSFVLILFVFCFLVVTGAAAGANPKVMMRTGFGDITLEIYVDKAPVTAGNFLKYVREKRFRGAAFYRVVRADNQPHNKVKISVIQGGLMDDIPGQSLPPIAHETTAHTGILHKDGVISMARLEPGTATSEFFICVGDQPELDLGGKRNPDGQGFAAFGRVIKGMDVVRRILQQSDKKQYLDPVIKISQFKLLSE